MSNKILTKNVELLVIGAGPAGLAAAIQAKKEGIKKILIVDRNDFLGGILEQCIHDGFGLEIFNKSLTGPEYSDYYIRQLNKLKIECWLNSMVISLNSMKHALLATPNKLILVKAKAVILSLGCREKSRGNLKLAGTRPAGIYTAGTAQYLINIKNYLPGNKIVILGSGDIGLIMARRLTLEGAEVMGVIEMLPYASGLPRNIEQCLNDYDIPLFLNQTVFSIHGLKRIEFVTIVQVHNGKIANKPKKKISCDTLLLSCGLIPENEIAKEAKVAIDPITMGPYVTEDFMTNIPGIFACGNSLHVHDVADFATLEAEKTARKAVNYLYGSRPGLPRALFKVKPGTNIRYLIPHFISRLEDVEFSLRFSKPDSNKHIALYDGKKEIKKIKFVNRLNPPEMVKVYIAKEYLKNIENPTITVV